MPESSPGSSPHGYAETPKSESRLDTIDCATNLASDSEGLSVEQVRFAEAIGQALVRVWWCSSISVAEINGAVAKQSAIEANV